MKGKVYPMKQLLIILLVCAVGYLLYDKFSSKVDGFIQGNPIGQGSAPTSVRGHIGGTSEDEVVRPVSMPPNTKNVSMWKLEHPETMTDEERQMAEKWEQVKPQYFSELNQIKTLFKKKTVVPYRYNERYAEKLRAAIIDLDNAVNYDDFLVVPDRCDNAKDALRRFESSCEWQAGVSKGPGTHMHSGNYEGSWLPDRGYVMVNRGGEMVAAQVAECRSCRGNGYKIQQVYCQTCNGRGRVPNPMAQVGNVVDIVGAFGGKNRRRVPRMPKQPSEINCSACNRGRIQQQVQCSSCNGQGKVYK